MTLLETWTWKQGNLLTRLRDKKHNSSLIMREGLAPQEEVLVKLQTQEQILHRIVSINPLIFWLCNNSRQSTLLIKRIQVSKLHSIHLSPTRPHLPISSRLTNHRLRHKIQVIITQGFPLLTTSRIRRCFYNPFPIQEDHLSTLQAINLVPFQRIPARFKGVPWEIPTSSFLLLQISLKTSRNSSILWSQQEIMFTLNLNMSRINMSKLQFLPKC